MGPDGKLRSGSFGYAFVNDDRSFENLLGRLEAAERYALDTEFERERTYWPRLSLLQVALPQARGEPAEVALVDALAVDVRPFAKVLNGPGLMVAHACAQDIEVLETACGARPQRIFDTQVAAGFAGQGSASLARLCSSYLGVELQKADRLSDWARRPLGPEQLAYAASDVAHLLDLSEAIGADLDRLGRLSWAVEECEALRSAALGPCEPERAWWRLRDSRQLRGRSMGVAQEVAAWRERRARDLDRPPRFVLPDLALQAIAHRPPADEAALRAVRGLDARHLGAGAAKEILAAVERGRHLDPSHVVPPPSAEEPARLRPAISLAMAWLAQLGRDERIDPSLLATRADVVAFLRGDEGAAIGRGWRASMVGEPLRALAEGQAALALDRSGHLRLELPSGRPFGS